MDKSFVTIQQKEMFLVEETVEIHENTTSNMVPFLIEEVDKKAESVISISNIAPLTTMAAVVNKPLSGATKLRSMLFETNELVVCPGVYDGLSARTALEVGFRALYMVSWLHIENFPLQY